MELCNHFSITMSATQIFFQVLGAKLFPKAAAYKLRLGFDNASHWFWNPPWLKPSIIITQSMPQQGEKK